MERGYWRVKLYAFFLSFCFSTSLLAADIIKVGIYDFPPYAFITDKATGISVQMIAEMNKFQDKYEFVAVPTTARRRYIDFEQNKFDVLIFENKNWGWQSYPVSASNAFVTGFEVYVTQAKYGRGQDFFSDFKNKAMIGVLGYHYKFADFISKQDYLSKNFNLIQTSGQQKSLELILNDRGEIAVLSLEYLNYHFERFPDDRDKLLLSTKYDQIYRHTILVRNKSNISVSYINTLLDKMKQKGTLVPLWDKYGLVVDY